jgi:hypothetical protein|tara:strand:- start:229 stop:681 length:453 start_codon:yes stop_codon:yes gene_type:complete
MTVKTYNPLLSEVLQKVHNAKTKAQKINILRENDSPALRSICKWSFDPAIESMLPEGAPPYVPNEAPEGTEHTKLSTEHTKLYHYIKGGNDSLQTTRREMMFVQLLEGLHQNEAELLINTKDKKLHQVYKGFSSAVVKEAFGWNDDYVRV